MWQLAIESDYTPIYSMLERPNDQFHECDESIDGYIQGDIDLLMIGGLAEWNKLKDAAETVIEQNTPNLLRNSEHLGLGTIFAL